jgi:membrane associated rhomboid family serine protease
LIAEGEWWRVITGGFLHVNVIHIAFNMWALYLMGNVMERVIGPVRFTTIYLVSLIGGSFGAILLTPDAPTVGASGAIFGLFAAFACLELSVGHNPMKGGIGPTIVINLVITLIFSGAFSISDQVGIRISVGGHVGGLVAGGICGAMMFGLNPAQSRKLARQQTLTTTLSAALGVGLFVAAIAASSALT